MSGIKVATVRGNLNKVVQTVRSGIAECSRLADAAGAVGRAEFNRQCASAGRAHEGVRRSLPDDVQKMVGAESAQWKSLLMEHDDKFKEACELASQATECLSDFQGRGKSAERELERINAGVAAVRRSLQGKDWYCDAENAEAKRLRAQANEILARMRRDVSLGQRAQGLQRESLAAFSESERLAMEAEREFDRLVNLAHERQERERQIKEENERKARNLLADIESLKRTIESHDYEKFGGEDYTARDRYECEEIGRLIENGRFESGLSRGAVMKDKLTAAADRIESAQRKWESQKLSAERAVADAIAESSGVDRNQLLAFAGAEASAVDDAFRRLESASSALKSENFDAARQDASSAIADIRALSEHASDNARLSAEREEMAQAIMQALYDANFDTPEYYLQDDANKLSDMCVVAAAPGGVGDMKLRIDLAGTTKFEVCNIPEGHEKLCIDQIRNLQKGLAEADIRFDMTDWGRANRQGKEHIDLRIRQQQRQQTIQRQG